MQINWLLIGICALVWFAGYCFGYYVGKMAGIKEGSFGVLDRMTEIIEKLPKRKEGFDYEHKKSD